MCSAIGLLLALPRALTAAATPAVRATSERCVADALSATLIPILGRMCVGLGGGMLVALVLCLMMPGLKRREL